MSLYSELSVKREVIISELTMLEKRVDATRDEVELKERKLDDIDKCLRALEEEK